MPKTHRVDSLHRFYEPFFTTRKGHILGLASPRDNIRDGLATTQIARYFPLPDFEGIVVQPSGPTVEPEANLILVGSASLFLDSAAHPISGAPPLSVGEEKLGDRLRAIEAQCCYRFTGEATRVLANSVTGQEYVPIQNAEIDLHVDYGVIRRFFRGPSQNTITLEGVHRPGTLGATKVATNKTYLDAIWQALTRIEDFDDAQPVEIIVKAAFTPRQNQGVYALENIRAEPLTIVYNREWVYHLIGSQCWTNQVPWDIHLLVEEDGSPTAVVEEEYDPPVPRLEIQADLGKIDPRIRALCRDLLRCGNGHGARQKRSNRDQARRLLAQLAAKPELFRLELVDIARHGSTIKTTELPDKARTPMRRLRKQFMIHLALGHILGEGVRCDDESVRRHFPSLERRASCQSLTNQLMGAVRGKISDGFGPLFDEAAKTRDYMEIDYSRTGNIYTLRLDRAALVVKLRV
jgi:hypothetical protein